MAALLEPTTTVPHDTSGERPSQHGEGYVTRLQAEASQQATEPHRGADTPFL